MRHLSESQQAKVTRALAHHERFKSSYMWRGHYGNGQQRARWSDRETWSVAFTHEGVRYEYHSFGPLLCAERLLQGPLLRGRRARHGPQVQSSAK